MSTYQNNHAPDNIAPSPAPAPAHINHTSALPSGAEHIPRPCDLGQAAGEAPHTLEDVKSFLETEKSWFVLDQESEWNLSYRTRCHGDTYNEEAGVADCDEAERLAKLVTDKYDEQFKLYVEEVDEWVFLNVGVPRSNE